MLKRKIYRGIRLDGWKVTLLEYPNGVKEFALYDDKGNPITTSQQIEAIGARIDIEKFKREF